MRPENVRTETIQLDQPRQIAFTLGAIRRLKEVTGADVDALDALLQDHNSILDKLGGFVWALLVKEDRGALTVEDIEDMISPGMIGDIMEAIGKVVSEGITEGKAEAATAAP